MIIPSGHRLLFIGDSITDCGRTRPAREADPYALGNGYVCLIEAIITATDPRQRLRIVNMGVSGDTVRDLALRWERDVIAWEPEWLSIMIGINDVWRNFDMLSGFESQISIEEYSNTLRELVRSTRPVLQGLVLMTPYHIQPDRSDPMRAMMDQYGAAVCEIATRQDAVFVDTQAAFDRVLKVVDPEFLAQDHIHCNLAGHAILARAFLEAIGFE